jgi:hypothetical protein
VDEQLNTALNSLSEQTGKINIALHYVGGDLEKARQMVAGSYRDLYALKAVYTSTAMHGAILIFFNHVYSKIANPFAYVIASYATTQLDPSADWRLFEKEMQETMAAGSPDEHLGNALKSKLYESFTFTFARELFRYLEGNNSIAIERAFQKLIQYILNQSRIDVRVEAQQISSLDMELFSATGVKLDSAALIKPGLAEQPKNAAENEKPAGADEIAVGRDGVQLILKASLILAPIKGKDISTLQPGDRVKVSIVDSSPKAVQVAQALNAYQEGNFRPVIARLKSITYNPAAGYTIFAIIAKGIFVKILEEEKNIRVAMDSAYEMAKGSARPDEPKMNLKVIMLLVAALVLLLGIVVMLIV